MPLDFETASSVPLGPPREKSEYEKMAEHLSVLGLDREHFCEQRLDGSGYPLVPLVEKQAFALLLHGQAAIMGALAIFARDFDPELGVLVSGESRVGSELTFSGDFTPETMFRAMDDLEAKDRHPAVGLDEARLLFTLALPTAEHGRRWRLWTGGERDGKGEVPAPFPESEEPYTLVVRLRDGRIVQPASAARRWDHDGGPRDILAYQEPLPGD